VAGCNYQFGIFIADPGTGELRKNGSRLKIQERPFQLLLALLEKPGEVATREELRQRLWPDGTYVDFDHSISSAINKLRAALNDSATHPRYIETVGRRGYRFLADVRQVQLSNGAAKSTPDLPASPSVSWRWQAWVIAAAVLFAVIGASWWWSHRAAPGQPPRLMLAVLPFQNLTGDPAQDYFSDGMTEEMLTQLGRLDPQRLGVIALRTSVFHYQRTPQELDEMVRQLGVQYVLEGSVRRDANQVRVAANLVQTSDQTRLFSREYDRQLTSVLTLQGEIAQEVADEIRLALGGSHKPMVAASASQPALSPQTYEAYDLYLKGRYFWNKRTPEGFNQAAQSFQQAIAKDPNYARAYSGLADTYALMSTYYQVPQQEYMPKARAAALKALALDPGLSEAHVSLALIAEMYDYDWATAEKEYKRAIELDPNYATAHQWYGEMLSFLGRFDQALEESDQARQRDPLSVIVAADHCAILYYSRQYERAIQDCNSVLSMEPNFFRARYMKTSAYIELHRFTEARREGAALVEADRAWNLSWETYLYARTGEMNLARQSFRTLTPRELSRVPLPLAVMAHVALGDHDRAIAVLEKAFAEHSNALSEIKVAPFCDPLRSDPRFQDIVRRVFGQ
jgi:TolB-like protein/DNA-binding winged helix-turn-helix (wHTH) protein/Tfp pilus assembly protein PilF